MRSLVPEEDWEVDGVEVEDLAWEVEEEARSCEEEDEEEDF